MEKFRSAELMKLSYKGYFKAMGYSEDELSDKVTPHAGALIETFKCV